MRTFFFTMAQNQIQNHWPDRRISGGYVEVTAANNDEARKMMTDAYGLKWAFDYDDIKKVHTFDRRCLATLPADGTCQVWVAFMGQICGCSTPCFIHQDPSPKGCTP